MADDKHVIMSWGYYMMKFNNIRQKIYPDMKLQYRR